MDSLTENEIKLFKNEFEKELVRLHESHDSPHSHWSRVIMPRQKIEQIIHHLKGAAPFPPGKMKSWIESRKFKVFNKPSLGLSDVLMEPTKEKVVAVGQASESVLPRYLRVVPREEIFDTLLKIHLKHNHSTLRETAHLVRSVISNIPRYLVHKFILLCPVCSNNGATSNSAGLPYTPSRRCMIKARRRRKLMDQFQVDVLDLKDNPDGSYHYILHCMDHITGFHWLFPLAAIDPAEVAQNLVWGIFSLFGFPSELVSDYGKEFASAVIEEVTRLWPDELHIKNYLEGSSYKGDVSRRNTRNVTRFIEHMAGQKAALGDSRLKWSEWLPEIQFLLNSTILDVRTGKTPYEKVFRMHPITPPPKMKLGPVPGEEPLKKPMPKRRRHHLKYTPEFLTEDVVDQAKVLTVEDQVSEVPLGAGGTPTHEVIVSGPNDVQFVDGTVKSFGSNHNLDHHASSLVEETVDGITSIGVAQEVVTTSHEGVPSSSAMSLATPANVVVVDIAGVEHTVENTVITDGYVTTGVEEVIPASEEHIVTQFVPGGGAYNFDAAEDGAYAVLPPDHPAAAGGVPGMETSYQVISDDPGGDMSFGTAAYAEDGEDETTYIDETSAAERCVTLSADGRQLEVAHIKPAPLPVKIGSNANKSYRIEPFSRTVEYVQENKARGPNSLSSEDTSYTSLSGTDASFSESVDGIATFRYSTGPSFSVASSSSTLISTAESKDLSSFSSTQVTSPTRNKRVIHLSSQNKRKLGYLPQTKTVFKTFEVTSFGPGSSPAPSVSSSQGPSAASSLGASGSSALEANGSSALEANGSSALEANGPSALEANGSSALEANGSSSLVTNSSSSLVTNSSSSLVTNSSSTLSADGSSALDTDASSALEANASLSLAPDASSSVNSRSEEHHTLLFTSNGVPTLKMPTKPPVRSRIICKGSTLKNSPSTSSKASAKSTTLQGRKDSPEPKTVSPQKSPVSPKTKVTSETKDVSQAVPVSKGATVSKDPPAAKTTSKSKSFAGFSSTKLDDIDPNAGFFNDEFESSDEGDFEGVLSGDESKEMYL